MAKFFSLSSSSSGNSHLITSKGNSLLIDAGLSCKQILCSLSAHSTDLSSIKGILITHEHTDHIKGLRVLLSKVKAPVYATEKTLKLISAKIDLPAHTRLIPLSDCNEIGDMGVYHFPISHDCIDGCGYRIETEGKVMALATDLGHITPEVQSAFSGAHLAVLEANYDYEMLKNSSYPLMLKQRIASKEGHLSNNDCAKLCSTLVNTGSTRIMLAHLSRENNTPSAAFNQVLTTLTASGMKNDQDYILRVAPAFSPSEAIIF